MGRLEDLYAAAARAGLLSAADIEGQTVMVDFRAPDETLLEGLALSTDYTMRFPASALSELPVGQAVTIAGEHYRVREVRAFGDGTERHASLTRLLELTGSATAADRRAAIEREYRELIERMRAVGDAAGLETVTRLIDVKAANADLAAKPWNGVDELDDQEHRPAQTPGVD